MAPGTNQLNKNIHSDIRLFIGVPYNRMGALKETVITKFAADHDMILKPK
jgi:hypothetical protein